VLAFDGVDAPLIGCVVDRPRLIGRGDEADVTIDDLSVSRAHMVVEPARGGLVVRDCRSRNGTFVDGAPIAEGPTFAPHGATIRLGRIVFIVHEDVSPFLACTTPRDTRLVGGPSLEDARRKIDLAKASTLPVLIEGETGSGKELVARAIHEASGRTGELVEINCAAIPSELVESELFGHVRGAFSGSDRARAGLFRSADKGTILLDEIGELPIALQAKLLRVLETGELRPVGEDHVTSVDVRIVAATNRSLDAMVKNGTFRADLLHRIAAMRIALPPLRERPEDIPSLVLHFLDDAELSIASPAIERLLRHAWPGNVRELRHLVLSSAAFVRAARRTMITAADVMDVLPTGCNEEDGRARILDALAAAGGNVTQAARDLGVARSGLYEQLRRLQLDPSAFRPARGR